MKTLPETKQEFSYKNTSVAKWNTELKKGSTYTYHTLFFPPFSNQGLSFISKQSKENTSIFKVRKAAEIKALSGTNK